MAQEGDIIVLYGTLPVIRTNLKFRQRSAISGIDWDVEPVAANPPEN